MFVPKSKQLSTQTQANVINKNLIVHQVGFSMLISDVTGILGIGTYRKKARDKLLQCEDKEGKTHLSGAHSYCHFPPCNDPVLRRPKQNAACPLERHPVRNPGPKGEADSEA